MRLTVHLFNAQQGHSAYSALWPQVKALLMAGHRLCVTVAHEKRTVPQNSAIHPIIKEIALAAGRPADEESLRVLRYLLLEAWRNETRRPPQFERSLDGMRLVDVSKGTSDLDKPDCSEFIEFLRALAVTHGVKETA